MTGPALRACGGGLAFAEELDRAVMGGRPIEHILDSDEDDETNPFFDSEEDADE